MSENICKIKDDIPVVASYVTKKKPRLEELAEKEDVFQHSMFEYYSKVYAENPVMKGNHHLKMVSDHFGKDINYVGNICKKFSWYKRAKLLFMNMKSTDLSPVDLPTEATDMIKDMVGNAHMIAKMGTKLIGDYLVNIKPELLKPQDVFKLGMLVVECVRVTNEVLGGSSGQNQGQTIQLVINE